MCLVSARLKSFGVSFLGRPPKMVSVLLVSLGNQPKQGALKKDRPISAHETRGKLGLTPRLPAWHPPNCPGQLGVFGL